MFGVKQIPSDLVPIALLDPLVAHKFKVVFEDNEGHIYTSTHHLLKLYHNKDERQEFKLEQLNRSSKLLSRGNYENN